MSTFILHTDQCYCCLEAGSLATVHDGMTALLRAQAMFRIKHTVHGPWIGTGNKLKIGIGVNGGGHWLARWMETGIDINGNRLLKIGIDINRT